MHLGGCTNRAAGVIRASIPMFIAATALNKIILWLCPTEGPIDDFYLAKVIGVNFGVSILSVGAGYLITGNWIYSDLPTG